MRIVSGLSESFGAPPWASSALRESGRAGKMAAIFCSLSGGITGVGFLDVAARALRLGGDPSPWRLSVQPVDNRVRRRRNGFSGLVASLPPPSPMRGPAGSKKLYVSGTHRPLFSFRDLVSRFHGKMGSVRSALCYFRRLVSGKRWSVCFPGC